MQSRYSRQFQQELQIKQTERYQQQQQRSQDTIDRIDQHLEENQMNLAHMEHFFISKRTQLDQLQTYLVKEFQDLEIWRQKKDNVLALFGFTINKDVKSRYSSKTSNTAFNSKNSNRNYNSRRQPINYSIPNILKQVKTLLTSIVEQYRIITENILKQAVQIFKIKLQQKDRQLQHKNNQIEENSQKLQRLKFQLSRFNNPSKSSTTTLRQLSRQVSLKKLANNTINNHHKVSHFTLNKSLSKSNIEDYHNLKKNKSRDNRQQVIRSPRNSNRQKQKERIYEKYLGNHKNPNYEQKKEDKSPTAKRIMFEVHKNLKDDFQNYKGYADHKKYVKQKIQCLKNKNSGIFNQYKPFKLDRKF